VRWEAYPTIVAGEASQGGGEGEGEGEDVGEVEVAWSKGKASNSL
jgi:hypothetical protein